MEELEKAFQVDGTRARYLVERRRQIGGFSNWGEVKQVPGFEDKMVENLQAAGLTITAHQGNRPAARAAGAGGRGHEERGGLDVNSASAEDLARVFQIDGERAQYLIDARKRLGGFESWDQIKSEVPSFEDRMVENMKRAGARIGPRR